MKSYLTVLALAGILTAVPVWAEQPDADNTGKNVRDRADKTLTPMDQGGSAQDRELTAAIRKAIVDDDSLSTNAQNVKIITRGRGRDPARTGEDRGREGSRRREGAEDGRREAGRRSARSGKRK